MKALKIAAAAMALALTGGTVAAVVDAPPAQAYTWSNYWYNSQTKKWWAYKTCTREEWFNGCTNGWYQSSWHPSYWN